MARFPAASTVVLNTGETGVVVQNHADNLDRPLIRILTTPDGKPVDKPFERDLAKEREFSIQDIRV